MTEPMTPNQLEEFRLDYEAAAAAFNQHAMQILNTLSPPGEEWHAEWDRLKALMEEALEAWRHAED